MTSTFSFHTKGLACWNFADPRSVSFTKFIVSWKISKKKNANYQELLVYCSERGYGCHLPQTVYLSCCFATYLRGVWDLYWLQGLSKLDCIWSHLCCTITCWEKLGKMYFATFCQSYSFWWIRSAAFECWVHVSVLHVHWSYAYVLRKWIVVLFICDDIGMKICFYSPVFSKG